MQTALDVCHQSILRKSGPFVKPTSSLAATIKPGKDKAITCAMSSASNVAKKKRSRGIGRKIQGLSPHIIPSPVSAPSATSKTVPAAQARRGLQKSKPGSGKHSSSSDWAKPRMLPPSTLAQRDLRVCLSGRHQQTSQEGTSVFSQAESKGARPKDQGGVDHSGGSRSSSHHKRTNQGQESSTSSGPPRPTPSAVMTKKWTTLNSNSLH